MAGKKLGKNQKSTSGATAITRGADGGSVTRIAATAKAEPAKTAAETTSAAEVAEIKRKAEAARAAKAAEDKKKKKSAADIFMSSTT